MDLDCHESQISAFSASLSRDSLSEIFSPCLAELTVGSWIYFSWVCGSSHHHVQQCLPNAEGATCPMMAENLEPDQLGEVHSCRGWQQAFKVELKQLQHHYNHSGGEGSGNEHVPSLAPNPVEAPGLTVTVSWAAFFGKARQSCWWGSGACHLSCAFSTLSVSSPSDLMCPHVPVPSPFRAADLQLLLSPLLGIQLLHVLFVLNVEVLAYGNDSTTLTFPLGYFWLPGYLSSSTAVKIYQVSCSQYRITPQSRNYHTLTCNRYSVDTWYRWAYTKGTFWDSVMPCQACAVMYSG